MRGDIVIERPPTPRGSAPPPSTPHNVVIVIAVESIAVCFVPWRDLWVLYIAFASRLFAPSPPRCCWTRCGWLPPASGRGAVAVGFSTYVNARLGSSRRELSPIAPGLPRCVPIGLVVFNSSIVAIEPGSPHVFFSCGEDGLVRHFDLRSKSSTKLFICRSFTSSIAYMSLVNLNAIAIDPRNPNFFAVAGADDYARVYDIRKYKWDGSTNYGYPYDCFCPPHLIDHTEGITGLAFSDTSELLASYINEFIYLFPKDQGLGSNPVAAFLELDSDSDDKSDVDATSLSPIDTNVRPGIRVYKGHRNRNTVKGVSFFGPNCEYVVSGSDCGRIFIWRKKDGELLRAMEGDKYVVNCIESHPYTTMIASSGMENDIKIWVPNTKEPAQTINLDEVRIMKLPSTLCLLKLTCVLSYP
ncbi:hypothetical protein GW17_00012795 [Ensete ventricosum]|nr:hypothetical protein GW17_00012795 [Ensete ventricosum]